MMRAATSLALCVLLLVPASCKKQETAGVSADAPAASVGVDLTPEQLGELGAKIKKNPADASKLLSERGLTEESFEAAIRSVTENKEASQRYTAAFRAAENG